MNDDLIDERIKTDFLIVGSGIAGLYTAMKLSTLGDVVMITKGKREESSTRHAQGGIAAVSEKNDSWASHMEDTLVAGDGFCDEKAVRTLVKKGPERVKELIDIGTDFDYIDGKLDLTKEGAHSYNRVLHARGDATGEEIRESLTEQVSRISEVRIHESTFLVDLIVSDDIYRGALCLREDQDGFILYNTNFCILATGGCGMVYENTTNPKVTTGDGVAVAFRAGANVIDMEFIQFHPTALHNSKSDSFLISEAVRGEGGILRNEEGERFMKGYHGDAELAPRDIVARAIMEEAKKFGKDHVWLDVTHLSPKFLERRFPNIYHKLKQHGIDMSSDWIPVTPSAHFMIGGIETDLKGRTTIDNLYACGEVACNGVHGANRLASNSLLEGLVFGHEIYREIKSNGVKDDCKTIPKNSIIDKNCLRPSKFKGTRSELKKIMTNKVGIIREEEGLMRAIFWLKERLESMEEGYSLDPQYYELKNMLRVGLLISRSAILREESRGAHFRSDYPDKKDNGKSKHIVINNEESMGFIK